MSLITVYNAGTVSVVAGSTQVTGHSTGWLGAGVREGDYLWIAGFVVRIASCEGGQALTLAYPWPSTTMNNVAYEIQYTADVERTLGSAQNILSALRSGSFGALSALTPATDKMPYYTGYNSADVTTLTSFGRQVLATTDKNSLQTLLDLVAQSGDLDKTLNRVMKVGAFGLGTTAAPLIQNIDSFEAAAGFYKVDARVTEGVLPPSSNVADGLIILHPTASQTMQVYLGMTELGRNFIRKSNSDGTWAPWRSIMMDFEFGAGPGSGLDADTVDGYEADDFVKATDFTSGGMLAYIKEVDGSGSGLDADLLDGQHGTYYRNAGNLNAGILPAARLSGDYSFNNLNLNNRMVISSNDPVIHLSDSSEAVDQKVISIMNTGRKLVFRARKDNLDFYTDIASINRDGTITNSNNLTTKKYVDNAIAALVDSSPTALNTLNELAAALGDDPNFATTVNNKIAAKLDTSAFTGSAVLNRLTTVDGSGSGLDADLLDGKHASNFMQIGIDNTTNGKLTFNGTGGEKIRIGLSGSTSPYISLYAGSTTRVGYLQSMSGRVRLAVDGGAVLDLNSTPGDVLINNNKVMHSGNHGVGSGFDADLLDGQHGTFYRNASNLNTGTVPAERLGNALLNTGGKITGTLKITYDSTITGQGNNETLFAYEGKDNYLRGRNTIVDTTLILANQASATNEAVRADRAINTGTGLSGGGNMTANRTISVDSTVARRNEANTFLGFQTIKATGTNNPSIYLRASDNTLSMLVWSNQNGNKSFIRAYNGAGTTYKDFSFDSNGTFSADLFAGSGASLTSIPATSLTGTINNARLSGDYSFNNLTLSGGLTVAAGTGIQFANNDTITYNDSDNSFSFTSDGIVSGAIIRAGRYLNASGNDVVYDTRSVSAGDGLTGGGNLAANRTISMGTPSSITATSGNSVTSTSHTHAISEGTIRSLISDGGVGNIGTYAYLFNQSGSTLNAGDTTSGSNLKYSSNNGIGSGSPSGTWRIMGYSSNNASSLYLRIA